jgi:hypothetical protein
VTIEPKSRFDLRTNFDLVIAEYARWPIATLVLTGCLFLLSLFGPSDGPRMSQVDLAVNAVGMVFGLLGLKTVWLLCAYPLVHRQRFPGSLRVAMYVAFAPIMVFYATGLHVLSLQGSEPVSLTAAVLLLLLVYALFPPFFAVGGRMFEATQRHKLR